MRVIKFLVTGMAAGLLFSGCTTTSSSDTPRTSMEQLLISTAVDRSLEKVDFRPFAGHAVFLDDQYLDGIDKKYVVGSIRHRLLLAGCQLAAKAEDAEIILEARSGGIGTDRSETFIGMPEIAVPGPLPVALPEVRLWTRSSQTGTAKIGLAAYDAKTRTVLGEGGLALARTDDNNWSVMGVGPFRGGSIRSAISAAERKQGQTAPLPEKQVAFSPRQASPIEGGHTRLTSSEEEVNQHPKKKTGSKFRRLGELPWWR